MLTSKQQHPQLSRVQRTTRCAVEFEIPLEEEYGRWHPSMLTAREHDIARDSRPALQACKKQCDDMNYSVATANC
jgi:hypothetical protein